jgi:ferrochelatase
VPDYDALLVLSFGGPEGPDDVRPFLENVTRGRGVPPERLDEVAKHYLRFGGVSPINRLNRELIDRISAGLPIYFGNRNWHPFLAETLRRMTADGVGRALVFVTSAYGGYSACRQYDEDIAAARALVGENAPELVKLRHYFDHPLFVDAMRDAVSETFAKHIPDGIRHNARLVFTAHSVPVSADAAAGPASDGGHWYSRQIAESARLVADGLGIDGYDVVYQSRSGPPQVPWLGPDIVDHVSALHSRGVAGVVVAPIGFVSDHLEVVWDLDTEAREHAEKLGMVFARTPTIGTDDRFPAMVAELVGEHVSALTPRKRSDFPAAGCTVNGAPCAVDCCLPVRRPNPPINGSQPQRPA